MKSLKTLFVFIVGLFCFSTKAQDTVSNPSSLLKLASGADSLYIKAYTLPNDIRILPGVQGAAIGFQSSRDQSLKLDLETYNNVSDLIGFGLTYKFIDFDLLTSLNTAHLLPDGRQNLSQFKLSASYTGRKNSFRGYYSDSKGMIASDPQINYESSADIHLVKMGAQVTHIFNSKRYSYRAANFQSELQRKMAGSFLLRFEPFYRVLGMGNSAISSTTRNVKDVFEDQAELSYVSSPGIVFMPGYGVNFVARKGLFYASPMVLFGPGFSYNSLEAAQKQYTSVNLELSGVLMLNTGYNGKRMYVNLRTSADLCYSYFDPTIFSTTEIKIYLTVGYRFRNLEKIIPNSLF